MTRTGSCSRRQAHSEIAARARHVLDVELLTELFRQLLPNEPSHHVGWPGGREGHDDLHRPLGIGRHLRKRRARKEDARAERQHTGNHVDRSHGVSLC
jgi:hypothetical protein